MAYSRTRPINNTPPTPSGPAGPAGLDTGGVGYWLVQTGNFTADIETFPSGQTPSGNATYLGPTLADANRYRATAAAKMNLPSNAGLQGAGTGKGGGSSNPFGFLGNIFKGLGGAAGDAGGAALTVAGTVTPATPLGFFGIFGNAVTDTLSFLKTIIWLFNPHNWLRMVEFMTGMFLVLIGFWVHIKPTRRSSPVVAESIKTVRKIIK